MKNIYALTIALITLLSATQTKAQAYKLDLGSSFSTAWASGNKTRTANNIGSSGINCTVSVALSGTGSIVSPYPEVNKNNSNNSDFVVQGSTDAMEVDINLGDKSSYVDITFAFSAAVQNVSFGISDIDMPGGSTPYAYVDQVTVTGVGSTGTISPTLTKYNTASTVFNISGNTATGTASSTGSNVPSLSMGSPAQNGTMFVSFNGYSVTSITIRYTTLNSALVKNAPGLQAIAFGNISFDKAIAPVTTAVNSSSIKNTSGATAISGLSGTDDESISNYKIVTIPAATKGLLTYNNGTSYVPVTAGLVLTPAQAASLKFTPFAGYTGSAVFTYTATDNRGLSSNTSNFTIPVTSSLLPVKLGNFSAAWNGNTVVITWTTLQEINSANFIVEKSSNGINWQTMGTVPATGNSSIPVVYYYSDAQPFTTTYYRLKQVDIDDAFDYSKIIKISGTEKDEFTVKIFPNPVVSTATITATTNVSKLVSIKVYCNNGILVKEMTKQLIPGTNNIEIPAANTLPAGAYTAIIYDNANNQAIATRFIKQ